MFVRALTLAMEKRYARAKTFGALYTLNRLTGL